MDTFTYRGITLVVWLVVTGWYTGTAPHGRSTLVAVLATIAYGAVIWR